VEITFWQSDIAEHGPFLGNLSNIVVIAVLDDQRARTRGPEIRHVGVCKNPGPFQIVFSRRYRFFSSSFFQELASHLDQRIHMSEEREKEKELNSKGRKRKEKERERERERRRNGKGQGKEKESERKRKGKRKEKEPKRKRKRKGKRKGKRTGKKKGEGKGRAKEESGKRKGKGAERERNRKKKQSLTRIIFDAKSYRCRYRFVIVRESCVCVFRFFPGNGCNH